LVLLGDKKHNNNSNTASFRLLCVMASQQLNQIIEHCNYECVILIGGVEMFSWDVRVF